MEHDCYLFHIANKMKKFAYYPKGLSEKIASCEARNIEEATIFFARLKDLSVEQFSKIYTIKEIG